MYRRRYLTFSLRTLFILLTAFAVWLGVAVNRAREQREAVEAIEALGGAVFYDFQEKPITHKETRFKTYFDPEATPDDMMLFRQLLGNDALSEIVSVDLSFRDVTDADLLPLQNLRRLKVLSLDYNPRITDGGLDHLKRLTSLIFLDLGYVRASSISRAKLDELAKSLPSCTIFVRDWIE